MSIHIHIHNKTKDISWKPSKFPEGSRVKLKKDVPQYRLKAGDIGISGGAVVRGSVEVDYNGWKVPVPESYLEKA